MQEFRLTRDKLVTNMLFQQTSIHVFTNVFFFFFDNLDLEQHGDDFLVCGFTSNLEVLADEFKNKFLVNKADIVSLKPEHVISGGMLSWIKAYVKSLLDAMAMNPCKSMATPGSKGQQSSRNVANFDRKVGSAGTSRVPIRCCNLSVCDRTTLRHCLQYEGNKREAAGPTAASKTKLKRIARNLKGRQRCVLNFPWVGKLDDVIHVTVDVDWAGEPETRCSTSGGVLAVGPCFTVRHWSMTQATASSSSAESEAKAITNGCIEALYVKHLLEHQTARPFKIEVCTDRCRRCWFIS